MPKRPAPAMLAGAIHMLACSQATALAAAFVAALTLAGCDLAFGKRQTAPQFTSEYQAVFMANGQVFFGKLENAGTDWPVLKDVYTIQNQMNPDTKQMASALVKRANDLHGPDHMVLNARQIALIEPVGGTSRVGQLISQAQPQSSTPPPSSTQ